MDDRKFKIQAQGFSLEQVKLNFSSLSVKEDALDRLFSRSVPHGRAVSLAGATELENELSTWLVVKNPPIQRGENLVLMGLDGLQTPDPWPTLHQCEVMVLGCDST